MHVNGFCRYEGIPIYQVLDPSLMNKLFACNTPIKIGKKVQVELEEFFDDFFKKAYRLKKLHVKVSRPEHERKELDVQVTFTRGGKTVTKRFEVKYTELEDLFTVLQKCNHRLAEIINSGGEIHGFFIVVPRLVELLLNMNERRNYNGRIPRINGSKTPPFAGESTPVDRAMLVIFMVETREHVDARQMASDLAVAEEKKKEQEPGIHSMTPIKFSEAKLNNLVVLVNDLKSSQEDTETSVGNLETKMETSVGNLETKIGNLETKVETSVGNLERKLEDLTQSINDLKKIIEGSFARSK